MYNYLPLWRLFFLSEEVTWFSSTFNIFFQNNFFLYVIFAKIYPVKGDFHLLSLQNRFTPISHQRACQNELFDAIETRRVPYRIIHGTLTKKIEHLTPFWNQKAKITPLSRHFRGLPSSPHRGISYFNLPPSKKAKHLTKLLVLPRVEFEAEKGVWDMEEEDSESMAYLEE